LNIEIANRLLTLRKQFNLSQEELAERLGISRQAVSRWERAEASPDTDNLINLSKLYGVSIDSLLAMDTDGETNLEYQTRVQSDIGNISNQGTVEAPIHETPKEDDFEDAVKFLRRLSPVYPILVTIVYLILGFLLNLWHPGWILFLTIPIFYAFIRKERPTGH